MAKTIIVFCICALWYYQVSAQSTGFSTEVVSSNWNQAVGLEFNNAGDEMFVWERQGRVWVVKNNTKTLLLDIAEEVGSYGDLGLLGFALSPQFDVNGYFYLLYNVDRHHLIEYGTSRYSPTANYNYDATILRLTRYTATKTATSYTTDLASRKILIGATRTTGIPSISAYHGPGSLLFGTDGTLLVSTGDGASASDADTGSASDTYYSTALANGIIKPQENVGAFRSQLLESYNGKILRIDAVTGAGVPGNPYFDPANPNTVKSKVYTLGLRNPFRMSKKPGTGSTNPADGNPGTLYLGDVGHRTWEELDVVDRGGLNLGWPLFEGLTSHPNYANKNVYNQYAPNPAYGSGGCTQQYFYFRELIKQATASGTATFINSCNSQPIPAGIQTFMHKRPPIDWQHGTTGASRTGIFSGTGTASTINIGAEGSPVSGPQFNGNCAIGGLFYTHTDFPAELRNTYIFADYTKRWIRNLATNETDQPVRVGNAIDSGAIVALATNPAQPGLYFIDFTATIKKITYNSANQQPVAVATSDKTFGNSPVTVQFTGNQSSDPDGQTLSYVWDFGDGSTSTEADPSHIYNPPSNQSVKYKITLTVDDNAGGTAVDSLFVYVNNSPPQVDIASPALGTYYPSTRQATFALRATVSDREDATSSLSYKWEVFLHHDEHFHPEPIITTPEGSMTTSPLGCGVETYYYRILLTVTDLAGLSTTSERLIYPYCGTISSYTLVNAVTDQDILTMRNGSVLFLKSLPRKLNIRANSTAPLLGKVLFNLSGAQTRTREDALVPYSVFGDNNGDYAGWNAIAGNYVLKATPYSSAATGNTEGLPLTINFSVSKNAGISSVVLDETGLNEINAEEFLVKYYPNPFKDRLTVNVSSTKNAKFNISLFDLYGRSILQMNDLNMNKSLVLGENIAAGVYILVIKTADKIQRFKLIKEH